MQFFLQKRYIYDSSPSIELDETTYNKYKHACSALSHSLQIENKYEILIRNYMEFEKYILSMIVESVVRYEEANIVFPELILRLNIYLVNILTSARLYIDQIKLHVDAFIPHQLSKVKFFFAHEYDTVFSYRLMEALRNYTQHSGLPIHTASRITNIIKESDHISNSIEFKALKSVLLEDNHFKKSILREMPDEVELKEHIRNYIEALSRVHDEIRKLTLDSTTSARETIKEAHQQYLNSGGTEITNLCIVAVQEDNSTHYTSLNLHWDNFRVKLTKLNRPLKKLSKRYVSGLDNEK